MTIFYFIRCGVLWPREFQGASPVRLSRMGRTLDCCSSLSNYSQMWASASIIILFSDGPIRLARECHLSAESLHLIWEAGSQTDPALLKSDVLFFNIEFNLISIAMVRNLPPMTFAPFVMPKRRNFTNPTNRVTRSFNPEQHKYYSKNAFRYICRIAMKEGCSQEFKPTIEQISSKHNIIPKDLLQILSNAEAISGPRFFETMIQGLGKQMTMGVCDYLLWFLEVRYMRYLCNKAAGRQKMTNKEEYVKYKNYVMIPMIRRIRAGL